MYIISFCLKYNELSKEEYGTIWEYINYNLDECEVIHLTQTYMFGDIDRDKWLYEFLSKNENVEWNE